MSTKATLVYSNHPDYDFHLYEECGEDDAVYLELEGKAAEGWFSYDGRVTLRIPLPIWEAARVATLYRPCFLGWSQAKLEALARAEVAKAQREYEQAQEEVRQGRRRNALPGLYFHMMGGKETDPEARVQHVLEHHLQWQSRSLELLQQMNEVRRSRYRGEPDLWRPVAATGRAKLFPPPDPHQLELPLEWECPRELSVERNPEDVSRLDEPPHGGGGRRLRCRTRRPPGEPRAEGAGGSQAGG